jgi:hypothetical protein
MQQTPRTLQPSHRIVAVVSLERHDSRTLPTTSRLTGRKSFFVSLQKAIYSLGFPVN